MKKKLWALTAAALILAGAVGAQADEGEVVAVKGDKILVEDEYGTYTGAYWYGGYVGEGDIVHGDLDVFGDVTWYNETSEDDVDVCVEVYWMNSRQAIQFMRGR